MTWQEMGNEFLRGVLELVIAIALPVVLALVGQWLQTWRRKIEAGLTTEARAAVLEAVRLAVWAAEQSGLAGLIVDEARAKKDYALHLAEGYLKGWGVEIDLDALAALIESAVWQEFGQFRQLPADGHVDVRMGFSAGQE